MASHRAAALLIVASLLVAAAAIADARLTAFGGSEAAAGAPLTCSNVHGVAPGETCFAVGQAAGLTEEQFLAFNPNINCQKIFVGQWLCLAATT
ncbi:hypothetical protein ACP4OV_019894 [Aristida adscensionis]